MKAITNGKTKKQEGDLDLERFSALRRLATDKNKRFVVSMGGGGIPSLCGSTVLADLLERLGLREHVAEVWGTSAGAIEAFEGQLQDAKIALTLGSSRTPRPPCPV